MQRREKHRTNNLPTTGSYFVLFSFSFGFVYTRIYASFTFLCPGAVHLVLAHSRFRILLSFFLCLITRHCVVPHGWCARFIRAKKIKRTSHQLSKRILITLHGWVRIYKSITPNGRMKEKGPVASFLLSFWFDLYNANQQMVIKQVCTCTSFCNTLQWCISLRCTAESHVPQW